MMMKKCFILSLVILLCSCADKQSMEEDKKEVPMLSKNSTSIIILGTIQDAGSPHIACTKECCKELFNNPDKDRQVVSLGLIDNQQGKKYLFEATPDISMQMKSLVRDDIANTNELVDGIFLTHAHIGHYTGLMYLGKEATDAKGVPVFAMPKMKMFLETNGPWSQLVTNNNIVLTQLESEQPISLTPSIEVTPFLVPHRDEYSETVGYRIKGSNKTALFIPDIDKWDKWNKNIIEEIKKVDYAFLDATFYSGTELDNRDISLIPHPFVIESLDRFGKLDATERSKIIFIHFNHTNPLLDLTSDEAKNVLSKGFKIGRIYDEYEL
jgi:pyrroloquinoline quinone biosynthesis protein B